MTIFSQTDITDSIPALCGALSAIPGTDSAVLAVETFAIAVTAVPIAYAAVFGTGVAGLGNSGIADPITTARSTILWTISACLFCVALSITTKLSALAAVLGTGVTGLIRRKIALAVATMVNNARSAVFDTVFASLRLNALSISTTIAISAVIRTRAATLPLITRMVAAALLAATTVIRTRATALL